MHYWNTQRTIALWSDSSVLMFCSRFIKVGWWMKEHAVLVAAMPSNINHINTWAHAIFNNHSG
jgi:hypothetical protein